MAGESVGGGGSQRVGGVHIDMTLRGAEQVKAATVEAANVAKVAGTEAGKAVESAARTADSATEKLTNSLTNRLASITGLVAAARQAYELGKLIEAQVLTSGTTKAEDFLNTVLGEGAQQRLDETTKKIQELEGELARLLAGGVIPVEGTGGFIVRAGEKAAKDVEEQIERLRESSKSLRESLSAQKEKEATEEDRQRYRRYQEEESAARARQIAEQQAYDEEERRKEIADARRAADEKNAEAEALERFRERGREMAKAFADELDARLNDIFDKINSSALGISNVSGSLSQLNDTMGLVARNTSRIQRP